MPCDGPEGSGRWPARGAVADRIRPPTSARGRSRWSKSQARTASRQRPKSTASGPAAVELPHVPGPASAHARPRDPGPWPDPVPILSRSGPISRRTPEFGLVGHSRRPLPSHHQVSLVGSPSKSLGNADNQCSEWNGLPDPQVPIRSSGSVMPTVPTFAAKAAASQLTDPQAARCRARERPATPALARCEIFRLPWGT